MKQYYVATETWKKLKSKKAKSDYMEGMGIDEEKVVEVNEGKDRTTIVVDE